MSDYQQLRLSNSLHLHENVLLILFCTLALEHEKAFITKSLQNTATTGISLQHSELPKVSGCM